MRAELTGYGGRIGAVVAGRADGVRRRQDRGGGCRRGLTGYGGK